MKEEDDLLTADFTDILDSNKEIDVDYVDVKEVIDDKNKRKYKLNIIRYYKGSPVVYEKQDYIVLVSNRNLTIVNINPNAKEENHAHVKIKSNSKGEINLSTAKFIIDCCINKKYPHNSNWCFGCCMRLSIDNDYKEWLMYKKRKIKDKPKYRNGSGKR